MSEENKIDTHEVRQCWGRLNNYIWQIDAATHLLRDNAYDTEDDDTEYRRIVVCNGMLAATSHMMTDLDTIQNLLGLALPDWDEIKSNQFPQLEIVESIGAANNHAG